MTKDFNDPLIEPKIQFSSYIWKLVYVLFCGSKQKGQGLFKEIYDAKKVFNMH